MLTVSEKVENSLAQLMSVVVVTLWNNSCKIILNREKFILKGLSGSGYITSDPMQSKVSTHARQVHLTLHLFVASRPASSLDKYGASLPLCRGAQGSRRLLIS